MCRVPSSTSWHALAEIKVPGIPIELVFENVRNAVYQATEGKQTPWSVSSRTGPDFYFKPVNQ